MASVPLETKPSLHVGLVDIQPSMENVIRQRVQEERERLERESGAHGNGAHHFKRPVERPFTKDQRGRLLCCSAG